MAEYNSNYEIAQEISARLGTEPIPFESIYELCLEIYEELGGTEQDFDDVYSILLNILPLTHLIDDSVTTTNKTWSSSKINNELANAGNYSAGTGVTISQQHVVSANSDATTIREISLSNGAPIDALGIWTNNVIPSGTSVQTILEKLLNRELFPKAATKPNFTVDGSNLGVKEKSSTVTITAPSTTKSNGNYNADFTSPAQPSVQGVTWSNETVISAVVSGFTDKSGDTYKVNLGNNKITFTYSKDYSAPSNMPITNQNHPTQSTTKISTDDSDISAIWAAGNRIKTADITATGCYRCFTNISGSTLSDNATTKCSLTSGAEIIVVDVPSENVAQKHFKFAFPADRTAQFKIRDLSGNYVDFSATYSTETVTNFYDGDDYKVITTTGDLLGSNTYKFILSKNLSE